MINFYPLKKEEIQELQWIVHEIIGSNPAAITHDLLRQIRGGERELWKVSDIGIRKVVCKYYYLIAPHKPWAYVSKVQEFQGANALRDAQIGNWREVHDEMFEIAFCGALHGVVLKPNWVLRYRGVFNTEQGPFSEEVRQKTLSLFYQAVAHLIMEGGVGGTEFMPFVHLAIRYKRLDYRNTGFELFHRGILLTECENLFHHAYTFVVPQSLDMALEDMSEERRDMFFRYIADTDKSVYLWEHPKVIKRFSAWVKANPSVTIGRDVAGALRYSGEG
jgi:hypothetical protein